MDIVALLEELVNGLIAAEDKFFQNPKDFYSLERSVKSTTESFSAAFLGNVLTSINEQIYNDGWRQGKYKVQRTDSRTLISSVGDVTFESTIKKLYRPNAGHDSIWNRKEDGSHTRTNQTDIDRKGAGAKHKSIHSCLITEYLPGLWCQGCEAPNLAKVLDTIVGADTIQTSRNGLFCIP